LATRQTPAPGPFDGEKGLSRQGTSYTMWPGVVTVPTMAVGGSDGRYLRVAGIPTYRLQGFFQDHDDVRAHRRDERMLIRSFYEGQTFLDEFVKALSQ
jgi:acetylornithine deacetylase/succinyl-diaminopimelate desuccinylase-like protein